MVPAGLGVAVELEPPHGLADVGHQARGRQLLGDVAERASWHVRRVGEECSQEANGDELGYDAEAVVIAPARPHELDVVAVEVEVAPELSGSRLPAEATVATTLLGRQEAHRHSRPPHSATRGSDQTLREQGHRHADGAVLRPVFCSDPPQTPSCVVEIARASLEELQARFVRGVQILEHGDGTRSGLR